MRLAGGVAAQRPKCGRAAANGIEQLQKGQYRRRADSFEEDAGPFASRRPRLAYLAVTRAIAGECGIA